MRWLTFVMLVVGLSVVVTVAFGLFLRETPLKERIVADAVQQSLDSITSSDLLQQIARDSMLGDRALHLPAVDSLSAGEQSVAYWNEQAALLRREIEANRTAIQKLAEEQADLTEYLLIQLCSEPRHRNLAVCNRGRRPR